MCMLWVRNRSVLICVVLMDRDLSRSRAILISNSAFTDTGIADLPAASGCAAAMEAMLTSDLCDWPADRVETLTDIAVPSDLARRLVELTEGIQDVLLLYYVGHGMRAPNGQLALALRDTSSSRALLRHTAITYKDVADILRGCPAVTKLVILDCCHAELGNWESDQFQSGDVDAEPVDGLYCIWASKEWEKARSPLSGGLTYFTDAFIEVVRTGIPGRPAQLHIDQIFVELRARMLRAGLPEPAQSSIRDARHWPFARNAAPLGDVREQPVNPPGSRLFFDATPAPARLGPEQPGIGTHNRGWHMAAFLLPIAGSSAFVLPLLLFKRDWAVRMNIILSIEVCLGATPGVICGFLGSHYNHSNSMASALFWIAAVVLCAPFAAIILYCIGQVWRYRQPEVPWFTRSARRITAILWPMREGAVASSRIHGKPTA